MPYLTTSEDCRIYFEDRELRSSGPAVVFLNGTMQTSVSWTGIARALGDRFQILSYDARGQGRSDVGGRPLSLELHTEDLSELLDHVGFQSAHLVGISHGVSVALAFASRFAGKANRLVLCSAAAKPSCRAELVVRSWLRTLTRDGLEEMARAALPLIFGEAFLHQNARILDKIVQAILKRNKADALAAHLEAVTGYPPPSSLAQGSRSPALVLRGSDDPLVTEEGAGALAAACRGRFEQIPGAGHSIPAEAPERFIQVLSEFLGL